MTMPAGKMYVGDLCYVMHDCWDEVCDLLFANRNDHNCNQGEFNLKDGRRFAIFNTSYGDGTYYSNVPGQSFPVDSGSIGCILVSDIKDETADINDGCVVDFDKDFECDSDGSTLTFGHIEIYTGDDSYEYDDEYDED